MGKHKGLKIVLILVAVFLLLCMFYITYDHSQTPPPPQWASPPFTPDPPGTPQVSWLWRGKGTNYYLNFLAGHRPNALEHYIQALTLVKEGDYFGDIMEKGLTQKNTDAEKEVQLNQNAISELILGAQMKHCELPPMPYHKDAPTINFIQCRIATNELILSARFDEWNKQYSSAMQKYLYGIQFGTDIRQKDQNSITNTIGLAIVGGHIECLLQLISSNKLKVNDYRLIITETNRLEGKITPISNLMETQYHFVRT